MNSMRRDIQIESRDSALCINYMHTRIVLGIVIITERLKPL